MKLKCSLLCQPRRKKSCAQVLGLQYAERVKQAGSSTSYFPMVE